MRAGRGDEAVDVVGVHQTVGGHIDADADVLVTRRGQGRLQRHARFHRRDVDIGHQPQRFGQIEKDRRGQQPVRRMPPAHQHLEPDDTVGRTGEQRLDMEFERA